MKISLVQSSIEWLDPETNMNRAEQWIAKCRASQLVVLPEMFTTGFSLDPTMSADCGGVTLKWMQSMATKYNVALAGSVAVGESGRYFNRLYLVQRDGEWVSYDKRHLFSFAGENRCYTAGEQRVVVEVDGVRILLLICYDIRFPVWSRNRGDYDMIVCVANWPSSRRSAWDLLLRSRAVENLCYVCGVNIVGRDPECEYSGGTVAVDWIGRSVASVKDGECGVAIFDVDITKLAEFRAKFPALQDSDDFELK